MHILWHPVVLISILLFCLNRVLELNQIYLWPLYAYLDDLLCMPLTLSVILTAERLYFKNDNFILPWPYTVWAVVMFTLFFEILLPFFSDRYTADALDMLAYAAGATVFHLCLNKPLRELKR